MTEPPPPGAADEDEPPAPGSESENKVASTDPTAAAAAAYGQAGYPAMYPGYGAAGYTDYYASYYSSYYPGYYGYEGYYGQQAAATAAPTAVTTTGAKVEPKKAEPVVQYVPLPAAPEKPAADQDSPKGGPVMGPSLESAGPATTAPSKDTLGELQQRMQELMEKKKAEMEKKVKEAAAAAAARKPNLSMLKGAKIAMVPCGAKVVEVTKVEVPNQSGKAEEQVSAKGPTKLEDGKLKGFTIAAPQSLTTRPGFADLKEQLQRRSPSPPSPVGPRRQPIVPRSPGAGRDARAAAPGRGSPPADWRGRPYRRPGRGLSPPESRENSRDRRSPESPRSPRRSPPASPLPGRKGSPSPDRYDSYDRGDGYGRGRGYRGRNFRGRGYEGRGWRGGRGDPRGGYDDRAYDRGFDERYEDRRDGRRYGEYEGGRGPPRYDDHDERRYDDSGRGRGRGWGGREYYNEEGGSWGRGRGRYDGGRGRRGDYYDDRDRYPEARDHPYEERHRPGPPRDDVDDLRWRPEGPPPLRPGSPEDEGPGPRRAPPPWAGRPGGVEGPGVPASRPPQRRAITGPDSSPPGSPTNYRALPFDAPSRPNPRVIAKTFHDFEREFADLDRIDAVDRDLLRPNKPPLPPVRPLEGDRGEGPRGPPLKSAGLSGPMSSYTSGPGTAGPVGGWTSTHDNTGDISAGSISDEDRPERQHKKDKKHKKHKHKKKKRKEADYEEDAAMEEDVPKGPQPIHSPPTRRQAPPLRSGEGPNTGDQDTELGKDRARPAPYFEHDDREGLGGQGGPAASARGRGRGPPPYDGPGRGGYREDYPREPPPYTRDRYHDDRFPPGAEVGRWEDREWRGPPPKFRDDDRGGYGDGPDHREGYGRGRGQPFKRRPYEGYEGPDDFDRGPKRFRRFDDGPPPERFYGGRGRGRGRAWGRFGRYGSRSPPRRSMSPYRRGRSRSRGRSMSRSRSRSASLSHSRSRSSPGRSRSRSRSQSPERGTSKPAADMRTKDEIAADIAKAAEAARLAALQQNTCANMQYTRHARRVYVGGLPVGMSEVGLTQFFNSIMMAAGATTSPGQPVLSCYMNPDKRFAFVELRNVEETSNAMAFDGIVCGGETLKIRRPHDYVPQTAKLLGPTEPSPTLNLALLGVVNTLVEDGPDRIFIGGLPTYLSEEQVRELLAAFGALKTFNLVMDRDAGTSRGYAFCEYVDPAVTNAAVQGLQLVTIAGKTLTARRASAIYDTGSALQQLIDAQQAKLAVQGGGTTESDGAAAAAAARIQEAETQALKAATSAAEATEAAVTAALGDTDTKVDRKKGVEAAEVKLESGPGGEVKAEASADKTGGEVKTEASADKMDGEAIKSEDESGWTCVVRLTNMVIRDELVDDEDYAEILEDTKEEVAKYGKLVEVIIPRPCKDDPVKDPPGLGLVFLWMEDPKSANRVRLALNGRSFGDNTVEATFASEEDFKAGLFI